METKYRDLFRCAYELDLFHRGKRIVLTNGVFDILHVGHLRFLRASAAHGDLLVVALNSDLSSRQLKGDDRPIVPLSERIEMLEHFPFVSYITSYDSLIATPVISQIKPHVYAKGLEYREIDFVEKGLVLSYGGNVVFCGDEKNHSTTQICNKIKGKLNG